MAPSRLVIVVLSVAIAVAGIVLSAAPFEVGTDGPLVASVQCRSPLAEEVLDRWDDADVSGTILDPGADERCARAGRQRLAAGAAMVGLGLLLRPLTRVQLPTPPPTASRRVRPARRRARHDV